MNDPESALSRSQRWHNHFGAVVRRDGPECVYCLIVPSEVDTTLDHLLPLSRGGSNAMDNLVIACRDCNGAKGSRLLLNFLTGAKEPHLDASQPAPPRTCPRCQSPTLTYRPPKRLWRGKRAARVTICIVGGAAHMALQNDAIPAGPTPPLELSPEAR